MASLHTLTEAKRILKTRKKQQEDFLKEIMATGAADRIIDALTPEQLRSLGRGYKRRGNKDLKRATACFLLADCKDKQAAKEANEQQTELEVKGG